MAFSEGLSDTGDVTGRGNPALRGAITGGGTFFGGVFHTLPFLISNYHAAIVVAIVIVTVELVFLAWVRYRFFRTSFRRSFVSVAVGRGNHRRPERRAGSGRRRVNAVILSVSSGGWASPRRRGAW
jgi:VIT1/CCC1 family predicted Fe2+/Mn2+ transporter